VPFQHHWLRLSLSGGCAPLEDFSMAAQLARLDRFALPHNDPRSVLSLFSYGWHFDAGLLAEVFRAQALRLGARQRDGFTRVELDASGDIAAVFAGEQRIAADFFVDCSGTRAALAGPVGAAYQDWSQWLPCDRLQYVQVEAPDELRPYSDFEVQSAGWRFSLPLQRHGVRGYVYASAFASDGEIAQQLRTWTGVAATPAALPLMRGRPREFWLRNCLLMPGEALEPLASAGLHLAQTGITRWLAHFPAHADSPTDRGEYNRLTAEEYDRIRDLLVLHYHAGTRDDSPFWRHCRGVIPPETLARRIALFTDSGRLSIGEEEHCGVDGWLAVLSGQGVQPRTYDPLAETTPIDVARDALSKMAAEMRACAARVPTQREFLARAGILAAASETA
jgi:tryptophan 7-halogenase